MSSSTIQCLIYPFKGQSQILKLYIHHRFHKSGLDEHPALIHETSWKDITAMSASFNYSVPL